MKTRLFCVVNNSDLAIRPIQLRTMKLYGDAIFDTKGSHLLHLLRLGNGLKASTKTYKFELA